MARTDSPRARLFVALDLPDPARAALVEWQGKALAGREDLRAVAPDALHVTLAFLGHRPEDEIEPIAEALQAAVAGLEPARLAPKAVTPVPRRRPRLFALDLEDDDHDRAATIHAAVSAKLAAGDFYTPEQRAFWPHVTVGRVRGGTRKPGPITLPPPTQPFVTPEVTLYRSHLGGGRGPASYHPLARWHLRPL